MQSYSEPDCRNNCAKHISSLRNTIFVCHARTPARTPAASSPSSVWFSYEARLKPHNEPFFATSENRASPSGGSLNQSTSPLRINYCPVFKVFLLLFTASRLGFLSGATGSVIKRIKPQAETFDSSHRREKASSSSHTPVIRRHTHSPGGHARKDELSTRHGGEPG